MTIWLDAQLPPALGPWLETSFAVEVKTVRMLGFAEAHESEIFAAAKAAGIVVMTKDRDFVDLVQRMGPPPQILWITCGNTSNRRLREILSQCFLQALTLLRHGEPLIEIDDVK